MQTRAVTQRSVTGAAVKADLRGQQQAAECEDSRHPDDGDEQLVRLHDPLRLLPGLLLGPPSGGLLLHDRHQGRRHQEHHAPEEKEV